MKKSTIIMVLGAITAFLAYRLYSKKNSSNKIVKKNDPFSIQLEDSLTSKTDEMAIDPSKSSVSISETIYTYIGVDKLYGNEYVQTGDQITGIKEGDNYFIVTSILGRPDYMPNSVRVFQKDIVS